MKRRAPFIVLTVALLVSGTGPVRAGPAAGSVDVYALPDNWQLDDNTTSTLQRWRGHPALMTMAYSTCRQVCLRTIAVLSDLQKKLDAAGRPMEIIVVSYDPEHDTPAVWSRYRQAHHLDRSNWHFLSGGTAGTARIAQIFGINYWRDEEHIMHDFRIVELDAAGHVIKTLDWEQAAKGEL